MDFVELADDLNQAIAPIILTLKLNPDHELTTEQRAELNLYYVACSRCKVELKNAKYI